MRRTATAIVVLALFGTLIGMMSPWADAAPPTPETGFVANDVPASKCVPTSSYEKALWAHTEASYHGCKRLHFAYGPLVIHPGQNNAFVGPITIEKPWYDGYVVRMQPDLVDASGKAPPIEQVHLHHGTWLNGYPSYGNGPFFAAGEEKTIATFPKGYGMPVGASDTWLLLFMVHAAVAEPTQVWVTYNIDFIAKDAAEKQGIVPVKPIWLDVQRQPITKDAPSTSGNPVFNVQKGFGHYDPELKQLVCTWPKENCARHDTYGEVTPQQGKPAVVGGADWVVPKDMAGTIVGLGGHLHPGGIRDEVSLVRDGVEKPIFISDAVYWDRTNPKVAGGPMDSWDFSMTVAGAPLGWKVKIKPGDIVRLNATYDSQDASWYENMGIVVALVAPDDPHGPAGVDVFDDHVTLDPGVPDTAVTPAGWRPETCHPDLAGPTKRLCLRGQVTHGHLQEASAFGGCPKGGCPALPKASGPEVSDVVMANFTYGQSDLGVVGTTGIPTVPVGGDVRFWNPDTAADIWHTVTRCKEPCTGKYGLDYPTANGSTGKTDPMDFDSTEVGYGLFFSPASGQFGGDKPFQDAVQDGTYWDFHPTRAGTYSFYCRIHPWMRGAIKVVK
jgi:plastocyanin